MEKMNIVQKVPVGSPTPWCSALHVVHKKNTSPDVDVRITIDPKDLNKALLREYHPMTTLEEVTTRTNGSNLFTGSEYGIFSNRTNRRESGSHDL